MLAAADLFAPIVITDHADQRIHERCGLDLDLDQARTELRQALIAGHYARQRRNVYRAWIGLTREYVFARCHRDDGVALVVITVKPPPGVGYLPAA